MYDQIIDNTTAQINSLAEIKEINESSIEASVTQRRIRKGFHHV